MKRVTAVVLGYWPNRSKNVWRIVTDLGKGTLQPDHTIVMQQGQSWVNYAVNDHKVSTVSTGANFHTRAKFITALLDFSDYYLLMDDDTSVGPKTLECLMGWAEDVGHGYPDFVTGYQGVTLNNGSFMKGNNWQPPLLNAPVRVHAFHGRAIFCGRKALVEMLAAESLARVNSVGEIDWPHEGDDLIIGMANVENAWAVPMRGDECFVDLDQCGQALQFMTDVPEGSEHYFDMRDRFAADVVKRLWQ